MNPVKSEHVEPRPHTVWWHSTRFDSAYILGVTALLFLSGTIIAMEPSLFYPILYPNLLLDPTG